MAQIKTANIEMFEDIHTTDTNYAKIKDIGQKVVVLLFMFSILLGLFLHPQVALIGLAAILVLLTVTFWVHIISIIVFAALKK